MVNKICFPSHIKRLIKEKNNPILSYTINIVCSLNSKVLRQR